MAEPIEVDGMPFALLVDGETGRYLVPPIVLDRDGVAVGEQNAEILAAIVESGVEVELPVFRDANPGDVAWIDRQLAALSRELGVPVGPPQGPRGTPELPIRLPRASQVFILWP